MHNKATKPRIMLDLDGCIYAFNKAALELFDIIQITEKEGLKVAEVFELDAVFPFDFNAAIQKAGAKFWENLELFPWAEKLMELIKSKNIDYCFFTSFGRFTEGSVGKINSLKKHFPDIPVIMGKQKWLAASPHAFLIDDRERNVVNFREYGGYAYRWPCEYLFEFKKLRIEDTFNDLDRKIEEWLEEIKYK